MPTFKHRKVSTVVDFVSILCRKESQGLAQESRAALLLLFYERVDCDILVLDAVAQKNLC
jgi:hypothetical protein